MENREYGLEDYRHYWLARFSGDDGYLPSDPSLESAFWQAAGLGGVLYEPPLPPTLEGLGNLAREVYCALEAHGIALKSPENVLWMRLAHSAGVLTDDLWMKITEANPYIWLHKCLIGWDRDAYLQFRYEGKQPEKGSIEEFRWNYESTLADQVNRMIARMATTLDPRMQKLLAMTNHSGQERLLLACQHIERLQVASLTRSVPEMPDQHEALAKMAASEFVMEDLSGLRATLEGFMDHTLLLVEEFAVASARPTIREILEARPGCCELLRLRDALRGVIRLRSAGSGAQAANSGELHAHEFNRMIAAVPAELFRWFRETYDDNAPEAMVLDALAGHNRKRLEQSIRRHSQMALKCHALLPLPEEPEARDAEVRTRYLQIEEFLKGSKKFGSERQANNRICAEVAQTNLALNAGHDDADELFFEIESKLAVESIGTRFTSGEYEVSLSYSVEGPSILIRKGEKPLKAVPAALKKTSGYKKLSEIHETFRNQSKRFRRALEKRMALGSPIDAKQLSNMWRAPILREMLANLLLIDEQDHVGLPDAAATALITTTGEKHAIKDGKLRIAHPVVMERLGILPVWRNHLFEREIVQPLRQVFREFYTPTPAEVANATASLRFAGHLLATGPLGGLMKTRGWHSAGFDSPMPRKFFNALGLTAHFEVNGGGYYLTETETVTSGMIYFENQTGRGLPLDAIPETVFSEVMRDVDLFVSVAQTTEGLESSRELITQRQALLTALVGKLKIKGVSHEGGYAVIEGHRGIYYVHLATGAVYLGRGRHLCIVPDHILKKPPKLFLPFFADDDRRIAEVFSKILLLCQDDKITDPHILGQIDRALG